MTTRLLTADFASSAALRREVTEQFAFVAPIFLKKKGTCFVTLPPDAKAGFDTWIAANRDTEVYDGIATLSSGYFGIRLKDDPKQVDAVLSGIGVLDSGRYIITHRPTRSKARDTVSLAL